MHRMHFNPHMLTSEQEKLVHKYSIGKLKSMDSCSLGANNSDSVQDPDWIYLNKS